MGEPKRKRLSESSYPYHATVCLPASLGERIERTCDDLGGLGLRCGGRTSRIEDERERIAMAAKDEGK